MLPLSLDLNLQVHREYELRLFSHSSRPVHLGSFPFEKLGRVADPIFEGLSTTGLLRGDFKPTELGHSIDEFMCALDAVREGGVAESKAEIPEDPEERTRHLKAAGYFLDAAAVGVAKIEPKLLLDKPHVHDGLSRLSFSASKEKLRLRFNPLAVIKQMERAIELASAPFDGHSHALVIVNDYPRDPGSDEEGCSWIQGLQPWRAAVRASETAVVLANYLRILGFEARSHSATTSEIDLHAAAVAAGLATPVEDGISNPYFGSRFEVAVVTTNLDLDADPPLGKQSAIDRLRAFGPSWWIGAAAQKTPRTKIDMEGRPYQHSRYPTEKLKRRETPTTFIDEDRIPRVPKSSEMFLRAAFGDLGKPALEASKDSYSVTKAPLAGALRLALNVYSLLQRGEPAGDVASGYQDPVKNTATLKATLHFLGADIAGVSRAPAWVWYSHRQDGSEMSVQHPFAASIMIDQGHETMAGASGDDWISSAQSMRTYMRAALVCGVLGQHLRNLGFCSTAHSAADSDVIQTPLVLLAGLGEVSRIGDTILNPFLGPRLKTGILTTNFPMEPDKPIDFGLQNFCNSCNKCARECPSGAISSGPKVMFNGYEIWKADTAKCTQYRMTNLAGAMCGRCMKMCPWNLEGLVVEAPFRWAAMNLPSAARWLARLDDGLNRGSINGVKKWWWDVARRTDGKIGRAEDTNTRELNKHIDVKREDQTLAMYPINLAPPPLPMPSPLDREAGIEAYESALSPAEYKKRLKEGNTSELVNKPPLVGNSPPVIVGKVLSRKSSSADGKIDVFEIASADGSDLPSFSAGAHVDITVTPQYVRQFSLAGNPADSSTYILGILREDDGRGGSKKIHELMEPGSPVVVSRPRNHFPVVETDGRHILMAGGIGVTPLIAMGHELHAKNEEFDLFYKARTRKQAAFIEELAAVAWADRVHFYFSDEDRLDISTVLNSHTAGDQVYTCGPSAFMDAVFDTAKTFGWPEDALHREYFSVPDDSEWENHEFEVELRSSGKVVSVPAKKKITEVLAEVGVDVDVKCSDGLCGVCATGYLAGDIEHRDYVLSKTQRESKMILCCSRAVKDSDRIVLDL